MLPLSIKKNSQITGSFFLNIFNAYKDLIKETPFDISVFNILGSKSK